MSNGAPVIRVMSLNCWGLKYVSKYREQRLTAIAKKLANNAKNYDIIALQEIWVEEDFVRIKELIYHELPYSKLFYSGILSGPGLCVFSRFPISSAMLRPFILNGRPSAFYRGDWYVGKSVASVVIEHPLQKIELLSAHMHAPYGPGDAAYTCHRTCQAWEMTNLARRSSASGHLVIVVGDLNSTEDSLTYRLFNRVARLNESWAAKHGVYKGDITELSLEEQIQVAGCTCDSVLNSWRSDRSKDEAKRLDYIFFDSRRAIIEDSRVSFTDIIPEIGSYSDHFAVEADLRLIGQTQVPIVKDKKIPNDDKDIEREIYTEMLGLIDEYKYTSIFQKTVRGLHFWLSIIFLIGLLIAVFWGAASNRAYVGFIFILVTILVTISGLIDGLISFLFGRFEMRALQEFESEIEIARAQLVQD